jgi:hypothetical protein
MLESTIQENILKYLNSLPGCVAENVLGCASQKDRPDINCCYSGRTFRIEVKTPDHGNMPTKGQVLNLKKWAKAGAICMCVWSLEDVKAFIHSDNYGFKGWIFNQDGTITKFGHKGGNENGRTKTGNKMPKSSDGSNKRTKTQNTL